MMVLALVALTASNVCTAQNAEVEKLFAAAKGKEAQAQKLRNDVAVFLQAAADYEAEAVAAEHEARMLNVQAIHLLRDANKERAFSLRLSARHSWTEAQRKFVEARNTEVKAAQCKHNAGELFRAANQVKDQASIAGSLENDAKAQAAEGQTLEQAAAVGKAEAERLDQRGDNLWDQAEKLDPDTSRQLMPRPPRTELRGVPQH